MNSPDADHRESLQDVIAQVIARRLAGDELSDDDVISAHPGLLPELERGLQRLRRVENARLAALGGRGDAGIPIPTLVPGYTIAREINHGGQAVVYLAKRDDSGDLVALKVMRAGAFADPKRRARFEREASLLAAIDHPGIVKLLDRGATRDGQLYLAMNYIDGEPLNPEQLASRSLEERLHIFVAVCRAVEAAHARGIVHRDLKPGNVRIDTTGRPHVLDFGLSIDRTADDLRASMTVTGQFLGSFLWASPEQQRGEADITPASDVYALGVVLHQMITGGRFPPQVYASVRRALDPSEQPDRLSSRTDAFPASVAKILDRCLARDPAERFQSAGELAQAIELADTTSASRARNGSRRSVVAFVSIIAVVALVGAVAAIKLLSRNPSNEPTPDMHKVNGRAPLFVIPEAPMLWIPPGKFVMGSPVGTYPSPADEAQHPVEIQRGFYMLGTEVTQGFYQRVMNQNPSRGLRGDNYPVTDVDWYDAMEFCRRLSATSGRSFRLPTEREWEYAARAGATTTFPHWIVPSSTGRTAGDWPTIVRYANFADRSAGDAVKHRDPRYDDGEETIAPIPGTGSFTRLGNAWGMVDMFGNVWEWTADEYHSNASEATTASPTTQPTLVSLRGGSFYDHPETFRFGNRNPQRPTHKGGNVGFRIVCDDDLGGR